MNSELHIQIFNLLYCRRGEPAILGPLSLDICRREFLTVIGPSSCGKTNLLKIIAGIIPASSGTVDIGTGTEPANPALGFVPERPSLLPWRTAIRNVLLETELLGLDIDESRRRARRLLAWFGIAGIENRKAYELSPDAAVAVAVCRALVRNPAVLLVDEPFRQLDPLASEQFLDAFQRLWMENCTTTILCTQNIHAAVLLSDRIAVLSPSPGRLLEIIPVDLPRPRRLDKTTTPQVSEYCSRVRTLFRSQGVLP